MLSRNMEMVWKELGEEKNKIKICNKIFKQIEILFKSKEAVDKSSQYWPNVVEIP